MGPGVLVRPGCSVHCIVVALRLSSDLSFKCTRTIKGKDRYPCRWSNSV